MARKDLSCLLEKMQDESSGASAVRAGYNYSEGLSITLDCNDGIENFEFFHITPFNNRYIAHYLALFDNAYDTLLRYNNSADSFISPISNWRDNIQKQQIDGGEKLYNSQKGKRYRSLVSYSASFLSYEDVERASDFFFKVFKEKESARKLQGATNIHASHNLHA